MLPRWPALLLDLLLLWTATGFLGVWIARRRGERQRVVNGIRALVAVWVVYLAVLLSVSLHQPTRLLPPGTPFCLADRCLTVVGVDEPQGFPIRGQRPERLVRIALQLRNTRGYSTADPGLQATLLDSNGRRFPQAVGISGVRLGAPLPGNATALSQPVFHVTEDSTGLRLELRHPHPLLGRLRLDDPESLLHRPVLLLLPPTAPK